MVKYKTMDANEAVSRIAYLFSEVCGIYPITPASPMAEHVDEYASHEKKNAFGNVVDVIEMQSEAGAVAVVHGALQGGALSTTFTASQGLLLMIPTLYKMAGELLPGVIHVAARSLSTHALSIFGDHQDVYAVKGTGVCMLASSNVEEAYHMAIVAHLSAIESSLPFVHFFDGFRTSHEIDKVRLMDENRVIKLLDKKAVLRFRENAMDSNHPTTRGTAENEDIYFQHIEARNTYYDNAVSVVCDVMKRVNDLNGTDYQPFNYYGSKNATMAIVAMGSVTDTIREVVENLNTNGGNYGVVCVHLYRPFSAKHFLTVLPKSVEKVAVLDRAKDATSYGEPLYMDVANLLKDKNILVVGGRYGLSSKNTTPAQIKSVFDFLGSRKVHHNFTVGICDDVTHLSLKIDSKFHLEEDGMNLLIYGYGSDGMVSTSKDLIKIIGDNTKNYVQGYFQYDSKKSGGVTRSHIRISDKSIHKPYYVENAKVVVVSKDNYMYQYDILDNIVAGGTLLLNTSLSEDDLVKSLPNKVKYLLAKKNINFYIIDAYGLVNQLGLRDKISTCMEVCIFELIQVLSRKKYLSIMKESNEKRFLSKGVSVVQANNRVVDMALSELKEINVDKKWKNLVYFDDENLSDEEVIRRLKGDDLPVSSFVDKANGVFEGGNTWREKRDIADRVPCWNSDKCLQCNQCAFVCPHGVIRPFLLDKNDNEVNAVDSIFPKDAKYAIGVSYKDCTGCGLCYQTCRGKLGSKAIEMVPYDRDKFSQDDFDYLVENNINGSFKKNVMNVKNTGFIAPKFEFSGSCAGCGETAYLKNLTQFFQERLMIANATGCSSIYGASVPSFPYKIAWANSLFEDNAEFGLGIYKGIEVSRRKIYQYMKDNLNKDRELFTKWLDNFNNADVCREVLSNIDFDKHKELRQYASYIVPNSMWIVGGDGFAYDIGYSGIDHVISRNDNINILVLDTEVYSNTGGQASKSSNKGAVAQFASHGKQSYKKDLARIAMCYPNCYVAFVNIGYDKEQYLRVLKEADEHNGPSIVIAYSPCIEHGIKKGMEYSLVDSHLATECGYFPIFRYSPEKEKFYLDSKKVDFSLYDTFLEGENRYLNLKRINPEEADAILADQKNNAMKRYKYYQKLSDE